MLESYLKAADVVPAFAEPAEHCRHFLIGPFGPETDLSVVAVVRPYFTHPYFLHSGFVGRVADSISRTTRSVVVTYCTGRCLAPSPVLVF